MHYLLLYVQNKITNTIICTAVQSVQLKFTKILFSLPISLEGRDVALMNSQQNSSINPILWLLIYFNWTIKAKLQKGLASLSLSVYMLE